MVHTFKTLQILYIFFMLLMLDKFIYLFLVYTMYASDFL